MKPIQHQVHMETRYCKDCKNNDYFSVYMCIHPIQDTEITVNLFSRILNLIKPIRKQSNEIIPIEYSDY